MKKTEVKEEKETLRQGRKAFYKYRGVGRCLSDGISFVTDHFWRNMRTVAPTMLIYALVVAGLTYATCNLAAEELTMQKLAAWITVGAIALLLAVSALKATVYVLLHESSHGHGVEDLTLGRVYGRRFVRYCCRVIWTECLRRMWEVASLVAIAWVLTLNIWGEALSVPIRIGIVVVLVPVTLALGIPLTQTTPHAVLMTGSPLRSFLTGYKRTWSGWSKAFGVTLLSGLLSGLVALLLAMPAVVFALVETNAALSRAVGDEASLPLWFTPVEVIILLLSAVLSTVTVWMDVVPGAYLFASLKKDADEAKANRLPMI